MTTRDLDFSRYAPAHLAEARPVTVWTFTDSPAPGELTILAGLAAAHARQIKKCGRDACAVIWRRGCRRTADFYHAVLHSLPVAWALAGIGIGFGIAFPFIHYFAR